MCSEPGNDRAEERLTRGYVQLCVPPVDGDGARTVALARFGQYEVRLVEFAPGKPAEPTPFWLELYSHELQCGIDSCRCYDLEAAVQATEQLMARARALAGEARGPKREGEC